MLNDFLCKIQSTYRENKGAASEHVQDSICPGNGHKGVPLLHQVVLCAAIVQEILHFSRRSLWVGGKGCVINHPSLHFLSSSIGILVLQ